MTLQNIDSAIIVGYFVVILTVGLSSSVISFFQKNKKEETTTKDYFLAGRDMEWWAVGCSLFASNIGSEHLIGLAGTGASEGMAVGYFEWSATFILLILGYIFVPLYMKSKLYTVPQFIEKRFSKTIRTYLASLSLLIYVFTKISVTIYTGAIVFEAVLGWSLWTSVAIILTTSAFYTIFGGLKAVIYTELLQTIILILGSIALMILSLHEVGGFGAIMKKSPEKFHIWKPITDKEFPWLGSLLGIPVSGFYYWCTDQVIVQRVLSAKNQGNAQTGCIMAGFLKLTTMFTMVIPGIIASQLFPKEIAQNSNQAFPLLVVELLPVVIKGIMITAMLSAAMSSLASVFNSSSTLFTMDIWLQIRPNSKEKELVWIGRISTIIIAGLSVAWIPVMNILSDQIFIYIQKVSSYLQPPIAAVFFFGIFIKYASTFSAICGLIYGLIFGMIRFILELFFIRQNYTNPILWFFVDLNYLIFAFILFWTTIFVMIITTILTPKRFKPKEENQEFCFDYSPYWKFIKCENVFCNHLFKKEENKQEIESKENEQDNISSTIVVDEIIVEENKEINDNQEILKVTLFHKIASLNSFLLLGTRQLDFFEQPMKSQVYLFLLTIITLVVSNQNYEGYKLFQLRFNNQEEIQNFFEIFNPDKIDIWSNDQRVTLDKEIEVLLNPKQSKKLEFFKSTFPFKIVSNNIQETINKNQREMELIELEQNKKIKKLNSTKDIFNFIYSEEYYKNYHKYEDIIKYVDGLVDKFPKLIKKFILGETVEKRPIYGYRIRTKKGLKKRFWINSLQHAREWITAPTTQYIIWQLLEGYKKDERITKYLNEIEIHYVPVLNVDGFIYTHTNSRLWRKNRRGGWGVDLNRNWKAGWGVGSSDNRNSQVYRGTHALSEPENQSVDKYIKKKEIKYGMDFHCYSEVLLRPWGKSRDPSPDEQRLMTIGKSIINAIQKVNGKVYRNWRAAQLGLGNGLDDEFYETHKFNAGFTQELRPSSSFGGGFHLPPAQILPCVKENFNGVLDFFEYIIKN
eukprot:gene8497-321_t